MLNFSHAVISVHGYIYKKQLRLTIAEAIIKGNYILLDPKWTKTHKYTPLCIHFPYPKGREFSLIRIKNSHNHWTFRKFVL
jgi:hypothetical protein